MVFLVVDSSTGDLTCHRSATRRNLLDHPGPLNQLLKHALALTFNLRSTHIAVYGHDSLIYLIAIRGAAVSLTLGVVTHPEEENGRVPHLVMPANLLRGS